MADKEQTAKQEVSANPMLVEFPRDTYQVTQKLRAEGLRASSRVGNDRDKLDVYLATLDVLKKHAVAAFKKRRSIRDEGIAAAEKRIAQEAAMNEARRVAEAEKLRAQLAALEPEPAPASEPAPEVK